MTTRVSPRDKRKTDLFASHRDSSSNNNTHEDSNITNHHPKKTKSQNANSSAAAAVEMNIGPSVLDRLGSHDKGMVLVIPPKHPEPEAVTLVRKLDQLLNSRTVKNRFYRWVNQSGGDEYVDNSARWIQGARLEVFLEATGKTSLAFDQILGSKLPPGAKDKILQYCRHQASQDPRVGDQYQFQNFSLIISWGKCPAQIPHIDLVYPNFQFGLFLSNNCTGTHFIENHDALGHVRTPQQLADFWNNKEIFPDPHFSDGMPGNIMKALQESKEGASALQLLDYFGDALHMESTLKDNFIYQDGLPAGTVASLPGSVVHAGPASTKGRTVLFFSASPKEGGGVVESYMPDTQYNGTTLMAQLLSILWRRKGIGTKEREYLLRRLVHYVEQTEAKELSALCGEGRLNDFITAIHQKQYEGQAKEDLILENARATNVWYTKDPFSMPKDEVDPKDMEEIGVSNLVTIFEGEELPVKVYRRYSDGRIILRYPTEGDPHENPDEYEGSAQDEILTLKMDSDKEEEEKKDESPVGINDCSIGVKPSIRFDGTNGCLYDKDGEQIEIYVRKRKKQRR